MSQIIPGYYDTAGAMKVLNVGRSAVSKIAKSESWTPVKSGSGHIYHTADVHEYRDHQLRSLLVKALGWTGRGLYRADDIDIPCPICEAFAVEWPATPYLPKVYLCLNGHKGDLHNDFANES